LIGNADFLLKKSKSEYVWFVGDDDVLVKGISKKIFEIFNKHNDISYIFFNHSCFKNIEQRLLSRFKWGLSAELQVPVWAQCMHICLRLIE
tara:strand:- start:31 stop:303 length:273 start_codon:yes stop_codon:yes gene_type:complete